VQEALNTAQVRHRELLQTFAGAPGISRPITLTRAGFKIAGADARVQSPPPGLGQHTREILLDLGYNESEIEAFSSAGAI
jgi:formyl-CoA transferase